MDQIESIIFDWGGVLIENPRAGLLKFCADAFGVSQEQYAPAHDMFLEKFHIGAISEQEFWLSISAELGKPLPEIRSLWYEAFMAAYVPKPDVFSLACSLHENGYRTALLSNTELPAVGYFHEQNYNMFDVLVFSCVERIAKPDPKVYEITLNRLGSKPQRTVLIDDQPDYVEAVKKLGVQSILFESLDQLESELTRLGIGMD